MNRANFSKMVQGAVHLATASGMKEQDMFVGLVAVAYAVAARGIGHVPTRALFLELAGDVFDMCERKLQKGTPS